MEQEILKWIEGFEESFSAFKSLLEKQLRKAEAMLLRTVINDHLAALKQSEGRLLSTVRNIARANLVGRSLDASNLPEMQVALKSFAEELLEISGRNAQYYFATGQDKEKVARIAKDLAQIRALIGLDGNGELLPDGYLYRLSKADELRETLRSELVTAVATRQSVQSVQRAFGNIILGSKDATGALVSYYRRFAYDAHTKVREVNNLHFADELGLNFFVYQGGVIKTTRDFCEKKNGRVFSREEALKGWPKDPDLIDKKTRAQYRALIDRGRYNCRHFLMWISDTAAEQRIKKQSK